LSSSIDPVTNIEFRPIEIEQHFDACIAARRDAYFCSFNTYRGFDNFIDGYYERMSERQNQVEWFYVHVWIDNQIAGQLEFRSLYSEPNTGYVHLIYLKPAFRGLGIAKVLQDHIKTTLVNAGCEYALLSVSRTNTPAMHFYLRNGWEFEKANPKHAETDFYRLSLAK
tara:strand:+ start:4857 stop:5360 length:504 start_codon:yes stop_codon:yes gene_type:complete